MRIGDLSSDVCSSVLKAGERVLTVCLLRAEAAGGEDDDAISRQACACQFFEACADTVAESGRVARVETQLRGCRNLVDVLAAGATCADIGDGDFRFGEGDGGRDENQDRKSTRLNSSH